MNMIIVPPAQLSFQTGTSGDCSHPYHCTVTGNIVLLASNRERTLLTYITTLLTLLTLKVQDI